MKPTDFTALMFLNRAAELREQAKKSATEGMNLGDRIAHVGGRVLEDQTVVFGSVMAVDALIRQVLRDHKF
jgi:hypothetical protein